MAKKIVHYGDPLLRQKAKPVTQITPEVQDLIDDMIE
ncbi:MAG: peptide deformylase, partial [Armatimonadetes bacterium]|nr:peptide deformylase [Armatimonadota bacterium]